MIEEIKKYKNKKTITFLPICDYKFYDSINYTLKHVIKLDIEEQNEEIVNLINNSKIEKIYLVGYNNLYRYILPRLKKKIEVCWIFIDSFSNLSDIGVRFTLNSIFEFYDINLIKSIGCVSKDCETVFINAGYKCEYIELTLPKKNIKSGKIKSKSIGILSNDFDPKNNFYNQLASIKFVDYDVCKFLSVMKATKEFIKFFDLKCEIKESIDEVMSDNFVNLYVNFTNTNNELIIKSFNKGIPCIVGNTDIFDNNKYLKEHLVIKSDDDINEIASKINFVRENYKKILEEYKKL